MTKSYEAHAFTAQRATRARCCRAASQFTRAADELAVTPAAVGQQIRALEDMLGVVMFRRTPKGLELTDEASAGLDALRSGFLQFEEAVRAMQSGQSSAKLTIAAAT